MTPKTVNNLGAFGENRAAKFLLKNNYQILARNFRFKKLEIDIIALDKTEDEVVFVEVKARKSSSFGSPALAVNSKKLINLQRAGQVFLAQNQLEKNFRFDIISILPNKIDHFKNVSVEI
jgi:putative endonuclease